MRKRVMLLALILVVGVLVEMLIWSAVNAAIHGDWTGVQVVGAITSILTMVSLAVVYFKSND